MRDLFEPDHAPPLARSTDPATSHEAASRIVPHLQKLHRWTIECVTESPGQTQAELGRKYCPNDPRKIGRRLVEVERKGFIRRGESRRCSVSGHTAATWFPAEAA